MMEANTEHQLREIDEAIRKRIVARVKAINAEIMTRLSIAADDLESGEHRAALGGLDGLERQIDTMRSLLLLLS
jgi:hypothetical protein